MASKKETAAIPSDVITTDDLSLDLLDDFEEPAIEETKSCSAPVMPALEAASPSGIEELISPVDDSLACLTWAVYGKNGTGKTTLLSTMPGMLILAAEDGTMSIRGKAPGAVKLKIDTFDKLEQVYWLLSTGKPTATGIEIKTAKGPFVVRAVGIDTVTRLSEVCMRNTVLRAKESDASRDLITRTIRDWGDMSDRMKYWLHLFKELPIYNIWTFQEGSNSENVDSDEFSIFPAVNASLRTYVLSDADIIARTYISRDATTGEVVYKMSAAPNPKFVTKDRTGLINSGAIKNPNLEKLHEYIFKKH